MPQLTRYEPFEMWRDMTREMSRVRREMDRLFETFGLEAGWPALALEYPAANLWEDENHVYCECELPGMELSDLEIYVTGGNQLTIQGERKQPIFEKGVWHRQERGFGKFARVIPLPVDVNAEQVEAKLVHGVLTITLPKTETAKPRKIPVKAE